MLCSVMKLSTLMPPFCLALGCGHRGSIFEGLKRDPIFQAHVHRHLAEDIRSLDGQSDIYTYAAAVEDEFMPSERPRMRKKSGNWSVELPAVFIVVSLSRY